VESGVSDLTRGELVRRDPGRQQPSRRDAVSRETADSSPGIGWAVEWARTSLLTVAQRVTSQSWHITPTGRPRRVVSRARSTLGVHGVRGKGITDSVDPRKVLGSRTPTSVPWTLCVGCQFRRHTTSHVPRAEPAAAGWHPRNVAPDRSGGATLDESCVASCSRESPERGVKLEARGTRRLRRGFVRDTIERGSPDSGLDNGMSSNGGRMCESPVCGSWFFIPAAEFRALKHRFRSHERCSVGFVSNR